jgi:dethiobiotin synthetase
VSLRGLFVTGTDTGVGKTVVAAALLQRLRADGAVRYWKPVQTGLDEDDDTETVRRIAGAGRREIFAAGIRLSHPLSPHQAARLENRSIVLDDLITLASIQPPGEFWIVEGAGGVLVPLNEWQVMTDLIRALGMPVVIAARSGLGTINHTLLTLEALRSRDLVIAGVVVVGAPNRDNREAIAYYGGVPVIGELPLLEALTPDTLAGATRGWSLETLTRGQRVGASGPGGVEGQ